MSTADCSTLSLDPDIAGIGIRVSLYILSLAGPIAAVLASSNELFKSIERSLGITGVAVLLTTFVSAGQGTLDLFHALIVLHLVGLTGFSIAPSLKQIRSGLVRQIVTFGLIYLGLLGFYIFVMFIFVTAPTFGSNPQCNAGIVYVLFGFSIPATNYEFRWLFISAMIFALFMAFVVIVVVITTQIVDPDEEGHKMRYIPFLGDMAGRAYLIAMLELIIQRNGVSSNASDWSFGQILAMMMLIGPLIELISLFTKGSESNMDDSISTPDEAGQAMALMIYLGLCFVDLPFNAAAGAAAAATGAHVNGDAVTPTIVNLGALAGVIKSGVVNYTVLVSGTSSSSISLAAMVVTSAFGMAFVVTFAIAERTIGTVPDSLLIAALAAGAPLAVGGVLERASGGQVYALPYDAIFTTLAGYTFAAVAHNYGYDVCSYSAASAAGAVYGIMNWVVKLPIACCLDQKRQSRQNHH